MKRKPCQKDEHDNVHMTETNLMICLRNQEGYEHKELNQSLHLQYYGFCDIDNLVPFKQIHTLFLNNNAIQIIQNLQTLSSLCTLNLSYNRIKNFRGIRHLTNLHTLDLSNNLIECIQQEQIAPLVRLSQLKLAQNKISSYASIKSIISLSKSLTCLDLSNNQTFTFDQLFYSEFLHQMSLLSILCLQNTHFVRSVASYRKETINAAGALLFLDDRPVSEQERALARAWKQGGLLLEKEVRQKFREKLQDKHDKIYSEMEERTRVADQKRKQAYDKLTNWEQAQLNILLQKRQHEDYEIMSEDEKNRINLQIDDYQRYLELMKQQMPQVDLEKVLGDGKVEVPKMLIDKETPQAIYVYNVSQEQIPLIKQKYYPNDQREIIAVNYEQKSQTRWIQDYDALLLDCYNQLKGNLDLLAPTFNLSLYDFDENSSRKIKRFQLEELKEHLTSITREQEMRQKSIDVLYELD